MEELTVSGKAVCNPHLERVVKELNEFIKEYNSKATRKGKKAFASREFEKSYKKCCAFNFDLSPFLEKICLAQIYYAENFKMGYISFVVNESPYLADPMREIAEIQKIYDSQSTHKKKIDFAARESEKLENIMNKLKNSVAFTFAAEKEVALKCAILKAYASKIRL